MTEDLIQKLMISKKIMDKHKEMPRGNAIETSFSPQQPIVEDFAPIPASYNIPEEYSAPVTKTVAPKKETTKERVLSSKLPDNIKKLMLEHPIQVPQQSTTTLSDDLVEKASRLMKQESLKETYNPTTTTKQQPLPRQNNNDDLKSIIRETMEEILKENGLLVESVSKTNDVFSFRVGKHIFEGKVTKIKKIQ